MRCCRIRGTIKQGATVTAKLARGHTITAHVDKAYAETSPTYGGPYEVTPTRYTQTLPTEGTLMSGNVKVNPIPSNYGLITYNGSVITVS